MATLNYVQIVGTFKYRDANETPARGQEVHFIPVTGSVPKDGIVSLAKPFSVRLNGEGEIPANFYLPTFIDSSVFYKVKEQFSGGRDPYIIEVKSTDTVIDLATVVPYVDTTTTLAQLIPGPMGPPGPQGPAGTAAEAAYTDEQAMDAVASMVAAGTHSGITFAYNDAGNALSATVSGTSTPTLQSVTSTATFTPAETDDVCVISAQAAALTMAAPAGTSDGRRTIVFKIKDNGTTRAITWNAAYVWIGTAYANTTAGKWAYVTAIYNATDSKWHLMTPQVQP